MKDYGPPISKPILTITELLSWSVKKKNKRSSFLKFPKLNISNSTKSLICHDMMNGYKDDRFDQGTYDFNSYLFFFWKDIDIFIYFSHYFISIPPFVWRVAAHRNNVPILGTIMFEDTKNPHQLYRLLCEKNICVIIEKLVELCKYYEFDGYLINFETNIEVLPFYK